MVVGIGCTVSCCTPTHPFVPLSPYRRVSHKEVQLVHVPLPKLHVPVVPQHIEAQHLAAVLQELLERLAVVLSAQQGFSEAGGGVWVRAAQAWSREGGWEGEQSAGMGQCGEGQACTPEATHTNCNTTPRGARDSA